MKTVNFSHLLFRKYRAPRRQTIGLDRKSTRLNSSHRTISYAVFCLKKKKQHSIFFASASHIAAILALTCPTYSPSCHSAVSLYSFRLDEVLVRNDETYHHLDHATD